MTLVVSSPVAPITWIRMVASIIELFVLWIELAFLKRVSRTMMNIITGLLVMIQMWDVVTLLLALVM